MSCSNCDQCARCGENNLEDRLDCLVELFAAKHHLKRAIKLIREATEFEANAEMYKRQKQFLSEVENYD